MKNLKLYDLFNESMEIVFQKNSKIEHIKAPEIQAFFLAIFTIFLRIFDNFKKIFTFTSN